MLLILMEIVQNKPRTSASRMIWHEFSHQGFTIVLASFKISASTWTDRFLKNKKETKK